MRAITPMADWHARRGIAGRRFWRRAGRLRGGFGQTVTDNLYEEIGGCTNPFMTAAGFSSFAAQNMAGIEQLGGGTGQGQKHCGGNFAGGGRQRAAVCRGWLDELL